MSKFKKTVNSIKANEVESFINGANERITKQSNSKFNKPVIPKSSFLLKLEQHDHELLKNIAEMEDRSMQWMLRKITSEVIRKKAEELGIAN